MENFTPLSALIGGGLIGLSATMLILVKGRIAGISGILGGALTFPLGDLAWRVLVLGGLVAGAALHNLIAPTPVVVEFDAGTPLLVVAGLLVGYGSSLGNGCTSGHGVCGLARLSPRSIAATLLFMAIAMATLFLLRHTGAA